MSFVREFHYYISDGTIRAERTVQILWGSSAQACNAWYTGLNLVREHRQHNQNGKTVCVLQLRGNDDIADGINSIVDVGTQKI